MKAKKLNIILVMVAVAISLAVYYYSTIRLTTATKGTISPGSNVIYTTNSQSVYNLLKKYGFNVKMVTNNTKPSNPALAPTSTTAQGLSADEQTMFNLVNKERVANGLKPLELDMRLVKTARLKSQDMVKLGYFDHQSPTYGSPFDMMKQFRISFSYAGENLAGSPDVNTAHVNLMNSPGHRENILRPEFTHIGIGVFDGSRYGKIFTQQFIRVE
ncbi:SCP-like extracellular [Desulfofarcimen acetoxidans DSM 771]|uniref:SCP-like extracellular n=1 Tax=Desulfofarcimen acetoxidans (strain ATCC 49208 / DSM 771 / KCTC 5769 / VKM B-1644 / 5575) TaxID=485916 RepID=C8VXP8_DESAS|nr:CAP domain-containing protein [Desulfofarcimen acetoxidans]ACV62704.1 SCP-like extracellular [Desulfofarcimen acetoxidans DSM 771]